MKKLLLIALCFTTFNANAELSSSDMQIAAVSKDDAQKNEMFRQLKILDSSIIKIEEEISKTKIETKKTKEEVVKLEEEQKQIEEKLNEELKNFNITTTNILKLSQVPSEVVILQDALQMQQKRTGALAMLKNQLTLAIKNSKKNLANLTSNLEDQKQKRLDLNEIQARLEAKKIEFDELRKQQRLVLSLPAEIRSTMKRDALYLANDLNLDNFLSTVKRTSVKTKTSLSDEKLPIEGRIVENYHDKDRITLLPVQGITIEGFARGKIRALHDGRVIYSGTFREYGHLVILEHQSGAHSLYAGFGKSIVDVGDYVNAGDLMGFLPSEEEPSLYYEVRINNLAQDPKIWLEKDLNILDEKNTN